MSCEVAEEAKENWFLDCIERSSDKEWLVVSSGIEPFEGMHEEWGGWEWAGARAFVTSRAEALHDLDKNSIGTRGLSGRGVPPLGTNSGRRQLIGSMLAGVR